MTTERADHEYLVGRIVSGAEIINDGLVAFVEDRIHYAGTREGFLHEVGTNPVASGWRQSDQSATDSLLLPGMVDLHCHGAAGFDFSDGNEVGNRTAAGHQHECGTTTLLASTMALPHGRLLRAFEALNTLVDEELVSGIHSEGPYLSPQRCGAQNPDFVREPNERELIELLHAAAGNLLTMTCAPELNNSAMLVDILTTHGVTPSLGHTNADASTTEASLQLISEEMASAGFDGHFGKPTVTHLFNAMPPMHHRDPGPIPVFLRTAAEGNAVVELIADGVHVDPEVIRTVFALLGPNAIALVSDSTAVTGLPDGEYLLGGAPVTIRGSTIELKRSHTLAGGAGFLLDVVRAAVAAGVELADAVSSATATPAEVMGLADEVGALRNGLRADCLVVNSDLDLVAVVRRGEWLRTKRC
ncbi:N-acetylglucosamine-6-phosphate deacetylase [Arthrobacter roseus]|uniref:N-acetylglucosamine-6-phosphate deacetylase n=1 Tax=Arthrobacter roseus TaxID=136274 RepID=UPI0019636D96|nr:amidohydrolase family protein [Arthrobacter roseus]MBM7849007.1 N-acetylglucosamine-6-phosphate deacetylase [Arthrobacter roseus]